MIVCLVLLSLYPWMQLELLKAIVMPSGLSDLYPFYECTSTFRDWARVHRNNIYFNMLNCLLILMKGLKVHKLAFSALYFSQKVKNHLQSVTLTSYLFFYLNTYVFRICKNIWPKSDEGVCFGIRYMGIGPQNDEN